MRIAFVWTGFTGYMADCWRELAGRSGVKLKIWVEETRKSDTAFDLSSVMRGLDFSWEYSDRLDGKACAIKVGEIAKFCPDVIFVCGWARNLPPAVAASVFFAGIPKILCCDMPWEWKIRKFAARFVLARRLRRFSKIMVPGACAARYARWLGFAGKDIVTGEYGIDTARFGQANNGRISRKGFVFVGRLVPEKGIRMLAEAYCRYRKNAAERGIAEDDIWPLDIYGSGDEERWLKGQKGIRLHGFTQPEEFPKIFSEAGALVLASKWEPWGVVLLEAAACGLPIVCTDACGAHHELVRENGIVVKSGNPKIFSEAMLEIGNANGAQGVILAEKYSASRWTDRIIEVSENVLGQ